MVDVTVRRISRVNRVFWISPPKAIFDDCVLHPNLLCVIVPSFCQMSDSASQSWHEARQVRSLRVDFNSLKIISARLAVLPMVKYFPSSLGILVRTFLSPSLSPFICSFQWRTQYYIHSRLAAVTMQARNHDIPSHQPRLEVANFVASETTQPRCLDNQFAGAPAVCVVPPIFVCRQMLFLEGTKQSGLTTGNVTKEKDKSIAADASMSPALIGTVFDRFCSSVTAAQRTMVVLVPMFQGPYRRRSQHKTGENHSARVGCKIDLSLKQDIIQLHQRTTIPAHSKTTPLWLAAQKPGDFEAVWTQRTRFVPAWNIETQQKNSNLPPRHANFTASTRRLPPVSEGYEKL